MNTDELESALFGAELRVLKIQTKLHRWASDGPHRRFDDLFNLVTDPAFLLMAWGRVRGNKGARTAGVDGKTARSIEAGQGVEVFLDGLRSQLRDGSFRPVPVRERMIPKANGMLRRLGIPTVADRVVQATLKLVLEPVFEADFLPYSYGFRPNRRAQGVDRPLDLVAALVHLLLEAGGPTASTAAASAVGRLVLRFRNGVLDLTSAQVAAVSARAVRLVAAQVVGTSARMATAGALDTDAFEDGDQLRAVAPLARREREGQRMETALPSKVNLASQAAPRPADPFVRAVLPGRESSLRDPLRSARRSSGVLVNPARGGIHAHHAPVDPPPGVDVGLNGLKDPSPGAVRRPPTMSLIHGLPAPEPLRQVPPRHARADPEQDPVGHHSVINPTPAPKSALRQMRRQSRPLVVGKIAPPHDSNSGLTQGGHVIRRTNLGAAAPCCPPTATTAPGPTPSTATPPPTTTGTPSGAAASPRRRPPRRPCTST